MSRETEHTTRRRGRTTVIRAHPDGPFVVHGRVTVLDGAGQVIELRRQVIALCRCGRSRNQPLCDGMHTPAGFECSAIPDERTPASGGPASDSTPSTSG